ncbi:3D domain-containing protein [Paenactinomyces guangxiensis]|uniref:G5 domain-containing protein n=1 Tax=Paenactinomyces guangxiensis TaxID=1490290 RepID=A0A7W1WNR8_9BACL|nr:3D domain-containing protein [Paenactinomyces guangxiensis]MBA4493285.1 G5 domain-containing protein [Paenactinomyces guangxiensis]MBH8589864.1 G5 domain-containing protein [Paenactinomyces guangxiensis]
MRKILLNCLTVTTILVMVVLAGCSSKQVKVTFSDQEKPVIIDSGNEPLAEALEEKGLDVAALKKQYKPGIPWDQPVGDRSNIQLTCNCEVTLQVGGKKVGTFHTTKPTVGAFLEERNVTLTEWDQTTPLDKKIVNGMNVVVDQYEQRIKKKIELIPFKTKEEKDDELAKGKKETEKEGKKGKKIYAVVMHYKNGQPLVKEGKPVVTETLVETIKPVDQVVKIGTSTQLAEEEKNKPKLTATGTMTVEATGYTHTGNRTATGTYPKRGTVAVDPDVIPLGTKLYIPGYGYGVAEDTGGAVNGRIIDLFFETRSEAIKWGRRTVTIKILK